MALTLYDLAGADPALRFSPYCWRAKLALAHKGLQVETVPWRFTEKDRLAFSGQGRVPVLVDGDRVVSDSWAIASYLEDRYPDRPGLFGGPVGQAHARFINAWTDQVVQPGIARLMVRDIIDVLAPEDVDYFRTSRERNFGATLEQVVDGRETRVEAWRATLAPVRVVLRAQGFLGGEGPSYAIISCSAACNGRAASVRSACWRRMIRWRHGSPGSARYTGDLAPVRWSTVARTPQAVPPRTVASRISAHELAT